MSGVRVSGLPASVTDKHLKVYFSNPKNGGGHVQKIFHPLPHGSAVVIFDDIKVPQDVMKRTHQLSGRALEVSVLPKAVFRRAVVEVERNVSAFLNVNPQLVDELQFIGEINVTFKYGKGSYLLDGSWYQLEWALHYLDTMLDAFGFDIEQEFEQRDAVRQNKAESANREESAKPTKLRQPMKQSNTSGMRSLQPDQQPASRVALTGPGISNTQGLSLPQFRETDSLLTRSTKHKTKTCPTGNSIEPRSVHNKIFSKTVHSDFGGNRGQYHAMGKKETGQASHRVQCSNDDGDDYNDFNAGRNSGAMSAFKDSFGKEGDSYNENEASMTAGYAGRSKKEVPQLTRGIDVSKTYFGEGPLSFTFELTGNIKVHVAMDDITKQKTDTIINPTTPDLSNIYGVSRAITSAIGYEMQIACRRHVEDNGPLQYADVLHTAAGGQLSKKIRFILHTAGPSWREDESESCTHMLVCTYINCFQYADQKLMLQSLATPLVSAGAFGFPLDACIGAFYDALLLFFTANSTKHHLKDIHLVCFDQDSAMATIMIIQSLLDCDSAQSVVAATDRYLMRSSSCNFQAHSFRPSGDENSDGAVSHSVGVSSYHSKLDTAVRQVNSRQDGGKDNNRQSNSADNDIDEQAEDKPLDKLDTFVRQVNSRQDGGKDNNRQSNSADNDIDEQAEDKPFDKLITEREHMIKHDKIDMLGDSDNETEKDLNLSVDVNLTQQPEKITSRKSGSETMYVRNADEDSKYNTDEEGNTDGENTSVFNDYLKSAHKLRDAHIIDHRSTDEEDADKDEGNGGITDDVPNEFQSSPRSSEVVDYRSTDEEDEGNGGITNDVPNKFQSSPRLSDAHVVDYRSMDEEDADKDDDCEQKDEVKLPHNARNYASHGQSNMVEECQGSGVPGNDVTIDDDTSKENESGDETDEELFL